MKRYILLYKRMLFGTLMLGLVLGYVQQITEINTKSYTIAKLSQRRDALLSQQQDLLIKAAQDSSIQVIRINSQNLVPTTIVQFSSGK